MGGYVEVVARGGGGLKLGIKTATVKFLSTIFRVYFKSCGQGISHEAKLV